jgi:basic membrane protein A
MANTKNAISKTIVIIIVAIIVIAAIGTYLFISQQPPTTTQTGTTTTPAKKIKVAILFDVGGRGDLSFNDMAWLGAEKARTDFNVDVEYLTPPSLADMKPLLESYSRERKYDLLVLVGFLWTTALNETADKYPQQKYAFIDASTGVVRNNVVEILFREQEVASLVGIIASGIAYELGGNTIAALAGMDIPPLWKFHIGYLFGAKYFEKKTGKKVDFLWDYAGTFTDPSKGKAMTDVLLSKGAKVVYGLAGATHLGTFESVKDWEKNKGEKVFALGQDASQEWIDPNHIPLSGAKRVDTAVYTAIKMVVENKWQGGIITLGLKEDGVGIWDLDSVEWFAKQAADQGKLKDLTPEQVKNIVKNLRETYIKTEVWSLVNELRDKIINGEIEFKTPLSHTEYEQIINELLKGNLNAALSKGSV